MADQKVIDYIKSQRDQRIQDPVIINTLLKAGYQQPDIDEGFKLLSMTQDTEIPVSQAQKTSGTTQPSPRFKIPFKMPSRTVFVILTAILVMVIGISAFAFVQSRSTQESEDVPEPTQEELLPTEEPTAEPAEEPTVSQLSPEQKDAKRKHDIGLIKEALEKYFADKKVYPESLNELYKGYLNEILVDPGAFLPYEYFLQEDPTQYTLCVQMEGKALQCASKEFDPTTL